MIIRVLSVTVWRTRTTDNENRVKLFMTESYFIACDHVILSTNQLLSSPHTGNRRKYSDCACPVISDEAARTTLPRQTDQSQRNVKRLIFSTVLWSNKSCSIERCSNSSLKVANCIRTSTYRPNVVLSYNPRTLLTVCFPRRDLVRIYIPVLGVWY